MERKTLVCPRCGSQRIWKDGTTKMSNGRVQRYSCADCAKRFTPILTSETHYVRIETKR